MSKTDVRLRIAVPTKAGPRSERKLLGLFVYLGEVLAGGEDFRLTPCTGENFLLFRMVREGEEAPYVEVHFRCDYSSKVISCANRSRRWDFESDWREGIAQVLWVLTDKNPGARVSLSRTARRLQAISERAGY